MNSALVFTLFIVLFGGFLHGCSNQENTLLVYSGKGLKLPMEEIKEKFEQNHKITINIVYAGSKTLLTAIQKTGKGDVFVPGSFSYIEEAGNLVAHHDYVALHVPTFVVRTDNPKAIESYTDLINPGIKIAVGNKNMCAIGKVADSLLQSFDVKAELTKNIVTTCSTVNELLDLVVAKEVDASMVWLDMLKWPAAKGLKKVPIPVAVNKIEKIHVAVLHTSSDRERATQFADFMATEGRKIFANHGFGEK